MKIEMKGINKSFGSNQVLKDAGFVLENGEVHALMGENGAGKSTLVKMLSGAEHPDAGIIKIDGASVKMVKTNNIRIGVETEPESLL